MFNGELVTELNEHSSYATLIFKIDDKEIQLDNMETKLDEDNRETDLQLNNIVWKSLGKHKSEWYYGF